MSQVYDIADHYVDALTRLDPLSATFAGVAGHDAEMTDFSPDGMAALDALRRETLTALAGATVDTEADRITRECLEDDLRLGVEQYDAGEHLRALSILGSPFQAVRMVFDLMPRVTEEEWRDITARLRLVPQTLASYRASLSEGSRRGLTAARRQAMGCAGQADVWTGATGSTPYFDGLLVAYDDTGPGNAALRRDIEAGVREATRAYAEAGAYLRDTYTATAQERDPVGPERYAFGARAFNGVDLDLRETYAWGWEQLAWVEREMAAAAERILPGGGIEAAKELLETDHARSIEGVDAFREWMQSLQDRTLSSLHGVHFDIPEPVRSIEAMIAPPGGALAMYYTGPAEDFSRPGRTWYPTGGKTRFPVWGEVSIAYHEGVPGHHLQIGTTKYLSDDLSRFQRLFAGTSGYVEGWALYAERLMGELGYLENPDYELGMLRAQALRCVRIVVDIGMHLELAIPRDQEFHPGETWTPELGLEMLRLRSHFPPDFVASEVDRYLGIPGQAISYKVGERAWLDAREGAKQRLGADFELKEWHNRAMRIGPMGLAQMQREMGG